MYYLVNKNNVIVDVDAEWDMAAASNTGGQGATGDRIIGRTLDDFLSGDATRMFVRSALDSARLMGTTRTLPYRCDSHTHKRRFEMVISPEENGHVRVAHQLISSELRASKKRQPAFDVLETVGLRCSQCWSVRLIGSAEWTAIDVPPNSQLVQDVCPPCSRQLFPMHKELTQ